MLVLSRRRNEKIVIGEKSFTVKPLVFKQYRKMVKHIAEAVETVAEKVPDLDLEEAGRGEMGKVAAALFEAGDPILNHQEAPQK